MITKLAVVGDVELFQKEGTPQKFITVNYGKPEWRKSSGKLKKGWEVKFWNTEAEANEYALNFLKR